MKKKTVSQPNLGGRQETGDTVRYKGKGRRNGEEGLRRGSKIGREKMSEA